MSTYKDYIRSSLLELSAELFPNNPRLQMLYQIGFLQSQLNEAMRDDNKNYYRFRTAIEQAERQLK